MNEFSLEDTLRDLHDIASKIVAHFPAEFGRLHLAADLIQHHLVDLLPPPHPSQADVVKAKAADRTRTQHAPKAARGARRGTAPASTTTYACPNCERTFAKAGYLNNHLAREHASSVAPDADLSSTRAIND